MIPDDLALLRLADPLRLALVFFVLVPDLRSRSGSFVASIPGPGLFPTEQSNVQALASDTHWLERIE